MKNQLLIKCLFASAVLAPGVFAAWTTVSTFDDASALDAITDSTNIENSNARSEIVDGKWAVYPGDLFESTSNLYAMLDLGTDLKAASTGSGGVVTVYFEITQPTVSDGAGGTRKAILDTVWGIANISPAEVLDVRFNSYNAMQRINSGNDQFEGRNGSSYEAVDAFQENVTYSIWLVIDYNLNYFEGYIQGGQWATQTKIPSSTDDIWLFRVNPSAEQMAQYFLVALSRGNSVDGDKGIDVTYFDNVAIDTTGQNLSAFDGGSTKGPGIFGNYDLVDGVWVNTGGYMKWVHVGAYPWVYLASIEGWAYIPDPGKTGDPDSVGTWMYLTQ